MEVIKETPITNAEALGILEKRSKEREMIYEQNNALEHLKKFTELPLNKVLTLKEELKKIEKLKPRHITAICNFLPKDKDELKTVLYKDYSLFTQDEVTLILDAVKKVL